jgi:hypothetical protein
MATETAFTPQLLGETEKALNAILARELDAVGLIEDQWITLRLAVIAGGDIPREQLVGRLAGALKVSAARAQARADDLVAVGLLDAGGAAESVAVTEAGRELHVAIRGAVAAITERLWGDLPAADVETTGRTLGTILARANEQFSVA